MQIPIQNNLHLNTPKTFLSFDEASGTNIIRWKNPNELNASWALQLGEVGEAQTEVVLLGTATPSGTAGTLSGTTLYPHNADTPIYGIKFDQLVYYVSTAGTAGTATAITGGTVSYAPNGTTTLFDYTAGLTTDAYKVAFRNSILGSNSSQSDWTTPAGPTFYSRTKMVQRIKGRLWNSTYLSDDDIIDWINECKDEMSNAVIAVNKDWGLGSTSVGFGTDGFGTIGGATFVDARRVWVTYNGVDFYQSTKMSINDYLPGQVFVSTHPYHNWFGGNIIQINPVQSGGSASIVYYQFGTPMANDTDELPVPFRSYTKTFVDYCQSQAYYKDGSDTAIKQGDRKMGEYVAGRQTFVQQVGARDKTGPTYVKIVEPVSGADGFIP